MHKLELRQHKSQGFNSNVPINAKVNSPRNNWLLSCLGFKNFLYVKGIQDKKSVAYFWLTIFSLLFAADFQANPIDISCKK